MVSLLRSTLLGQLLGKEKNPTGNVKGNDLTLVSDVYDDGGDREREENEKCVSEDFVRK